MSLQKRIQKRTTRRTHRVRNKLRTINRTGRYRVSVFRSNKDLYLQVIDDSNGHTIIGMAASSLAGITGDKSERARQLGIRVGQKAVEQNVTEVLFDRGSYLYHGRVKAAAEGLREGGLQF